MCSTADDGVPELPVHADWGLSVSLDLRGMDFMTGVGWSKVLGWFYLSRFPSLLVYMCYEWLIRPASDDLTHECRRCGEDYQGNELCYIEGFHRLEVQFCPAYGLRRPSLVKPALRIPPSV
jgi:hypothetical protein